MKTHISTVIICTFLLNTLGPMPAGAQELVLPKPGVMVALSPAFTPAHLKGITIHQDNALRFDFLINKGDAPLADAQKKQEYNALIKYFLASLTVPDKDQWVNLSPYEKDRIIEGNFGKTEMGRDLLGQDYLLKQITASLIYPEKGLGEKFWNTVYERAFKEFGTTNIPVNTFNKVWIIPDQAVVYESGNTAYILKSHLKVMLEQDYLALEKNRRQPGDMLRKPEGIATCPQAPCQANEGLTTKATQRNVPNALASEIVREIVLPALEKEVNEGKNFAQLRQIYSGMILATWYKKALKESLLGKVYADKDKVKGVDQDPKANEDIYQQYLQAFKKGVFNYIKEDDDKYTQERIPRKYFSGGMRKGKVTVVREKQVRQSRDLTMAAAKGADEAMGAKDERVITDLTLENPDAAMATANNVGEIKRERIAVLRQLRKNLGRDADTGGVSEGVASSLHLLMGVDSRLAFYLQFSRKQQDEQFVRTLRFEMRFIEGVNSRNFSASMSQLVKLGYGPTKRVTSDTAMTGDKGVDPVMLNRREILRGAAGALGLSVLNSFSALAQNSTRNDIARMTEALSTMFSDSPNNKLRGVDLQLPGIDQVMNGYRDAIVRTLSNDEILALPFNRMAWGTYFYPDAQRAVLRIMVDIAKAKGDKKILSRMISEGARATLAEANQTASVVGSRFINYINFFQSILNDAQLKGYLTNVQVEGIQKAIDHARSLISTDKTAGKFSAIQRQSDPNVVIQQSLELWKGRVPEHDRLIGVDTTRITPDDGWRDIGNGVRASLPYSNGQRAIMAKAEKIYNILVEHKGLAGQWQNVATPNLISISHQESSKTAAEVRTLFAEDYLAFIVSGDLTHTHWYIGKNGDNVGYNANENIQARRTFFNQYVFQGKVENKPTLGDLQEQLKSLIDRAMTIDVAMTAALTPDMNNMLKSLNDQGATLVSNLLKNLLEGMIERRGRPQGKEWFAMYDSYKQEVEAFNRGHGSNPLVILSLDEMQKMVKLAGISADTVAVLLKAVTEAFVGKQTIRMNVGTEGIYQKEATRPASLLSAAAYQLLSSPQLVILRDDPDKGQKANALIAHFLRHETAPQAGEMEPLDELPKDPYISAIQHYDVNIGFDQKGMENWLSALSDTAMTARNEDAVNGLLSDLTKKYLAALADPTTLSPKSLVVNGMRSTVLREARADLLMSIIAGKKPESLAAAHTIFDQLIARQYGAIGREEQTVVVDILSNYFIDDPADQLQLQQGFQDLLDSYSRAMTVTNETFTLQEVGYGPTEFLDFKGEPIVAKGSKGNNSQTFRLLAGKGDNERNLYIVPTRQSEGLYIYAGRVNDEPHIRKIATALINKVNASTPVTEIARMFKVELVFEAVVQRYVAALKEAQKSGDDLDQARTDLVIAIISGRRPKDLSGAIEILAELARQYNFTIDQEERSAVTSKVLHFFDPKSHDPDQVALRMSELLRSVDTAMANPEDKALMGQPVGGIDMNSANMDLQIKRDGKGVPLPIQFQDMEKLRNIQGFVPVIIQIIPVTSLPFLSELQKKLQLPQALASVS